jgi:hypothetical protein
MNSAPEHGLWCQDMCPCVPIENATIAPPQGFHGRRRARRLGAGAADAAADAADAAADAADDAFFEPPVFDALGRREPAAYGRARAARAARAAAAAAAAAAP